MTRYLIIGLCIISTGCKQLGLSRPVHRVHEKPVVYIGAGQSNMYYTNLGAYFLPELQNNQAGVDNVAVCGTSLSQWVKGGESYHRIIDSAHGHEVGALLFWQGESEGLPKGDDPSTWAMRFTQMVADIRNDLKRPDLPVVFVQIGANVGYGVPWDEVKRQQASVLISGVTMVTSDDAELRPDGLHFTEAGYKKVAKRLADAVRLEEL